MKFVCLSQRVCGYRVPQGSAWPSMAMHWPHHDDDDNDDDADADAHAHEHNHGYIHICRLRIDPLFARL